MVFRLLEEKISKLILLIEVQKVTFRQMQSLLGLLGIKLPHHRIHITPSLRTDLAVWREFLSSYCHTCFQLSDSSNEDLSVSFSDTAGLSSFGVIFGEQWCAER
ncbi:unnamed protein product [Ranitomeya imitator]|uniref:Uncharacterized protein n=1 Tax=Ranitomeya imitator TaxID=111125 RepID=A0ABN9M5I8_9NEOB|nr:unnamed protein product [Ranitomeya imitator]